MISSRPFVLTAGLATSIFASQLSAQALFPDHRIDAILEQVSPERRESSLQVLTNFETRHTLSALRDSRTVRVFAQGPEDSPSRHLARFIRRHAAIYVPGHEVRLIAREDRFGRGGDHTAFNQLGYAGVRFSESRENYSRQHTVDDTIDGVDFEYLARNARVNAAGVLTIGLAPAAPNVSGQFGPRLGRGESGYDALLEWQPSAGATGYRVFWREAWTPDWEHELYVGNVAEYTLPNISIDDYIFGVAAVGADGHERLVTPYVRPPRANVEVREVR